MGEATDWLMPLPCQVTIGKGSLRNSQIHVHAGVVAYVHVHVHVHVHTLHIGHCFNSFYIAKGEVNNFVTSVTIAVFFQD